jgi:hypothetical protein
VFAYESYKPLKKLDQIEAFIQDQNISNKVNVKGTTIPVLNVAVQAMLEVIERFDLKPLAAFGPVSRFYARNRGSAGVLASMYSSVQSAQGGRGLFHIPATGFGQDVDAAAQRAIRAIPKHRMNRDAVLEGTARGLDAVKAQNIDPEVRVRIKQMEAQDRGDAPYAFTIDATSSDMEETVRSTVFHEYGHAIHLAQIGNTDIGAMLDKFLRDYNPRLHGWDFLVSVYGDTNDKEYIAETFALYVGMPESEHFRIHPALLEIYRKLDKKVTR